MVVSSCGSFLFTARHRHLSGRILRLAADLAALHQSSAVYPPPPRWTRIFLATSAGTVGAGGIAPNDLGQHSPHTFNATVRLRHSSGGGLHRADRSAAIIVCLEWVHRHGKARRISASSVRAILSLRFPASTTAYQRRTRGRYHAFAKRFGRPAVLAYVKGGAPGPAPAFRGLRSGDAERIECEITRTGLHGRGAYGMEVCAGLAVFTEYNYFDSEPRRAILFDGWSRLRR